MHTSSRSYLLAATWLCLIVACDSGGTAPGGGEGPGGANGEGAASGGGAAGGEAAGKGGGSRDGGKSGNDDTGGAGVGGLAGGSPPAPPIIDIGKIDEPKPVGESCAPALPQAPFDVRAANRRAPLPGLRDWRGVGYRAGLHEVPKGNRTVAAAGFGVVADDGKDDSDALARAVAAAKAQPGSYDDVAVISLPAGRIDVSKPISIDASHVILRGAGSDPKGVHTRIVVRPGPLLAYQALSQDGSQPDLEALASGAGKGGWLWPGRGVFRVETRGVHEDYARDHARAPDASKAIFEGTVNVHWKSGVPVRQSADYAAKAGETVIALDTSVTADEWRRFAVGKSVWVGAANSLAMYELQGVAPEHRENGHMRAQMFTITKVDQAARTITIDKPLEFDLPANSTSDGSAPLTGSKPYESKVTPLEVIENVGFENFYLTFDLEGLPKSSGGTYKLDAAKAANDYGNLAPEYAIHGIVFKFAVNGWVRGVRMFMTGSHPVVTEVARHLTIEGNMFEGSWNKGKGGHGYLRGSRVWDSLYHANVTRGLRHFTFQWSASGNVAIGNDFDSDINLHGGWERNNLIELNVVRVPFEHAPGRCSSNCGAEGGGVEDGTWYPIWWGAGRKAGKWSGATGPNNVLQNNRLEKQTRAGGPFLPYVPYAAADGSVCRTRFQLGVDRETGMKWTALGKMGQTITDWAGNETVDFSRSPNDGVKATLNAPEASIFLAR